MSTKRIFEEAIRSSLDRFLGNKLNQGTTDDVKKAVKKVMTSMADVLEIKAELPRVEVTQNETDPNMVEISLYDPKTGDKISLSDWTSRCVK